MKSKYFLLPLFLFLIVSLIVSCGRKNPMDIKPASLSKKQSERGGGELFIFDNLNVDPKITVWGNAVGKVYGDEYNGKYYYRDDCSTINSKELYYEQEMELGHLHVGSSMPDGNMDYGIYDYFVKYLNVTKSFTIDYRYCKYKLSSTFYNLYDVKISVDTLPGDFQLKITMARGPYVGDNAAGNTYEIRELRGKNGGSNDHSDFVNDYKDPVSSVSISGPDLVVPYSYVTYNSVTYPEKRQLEKYYRWYKKTYEGLESTREEFPWVLISEGYSATSVSFQTNQWTYDIQLKVTDERYSAVKESNIIQVNVQQ